MAYCPKCGTPVTAQAPHRPYRYEDRFFPTALFAVAGVIIAAAIIVVALLAIGVLPGFQMPFGQVGSGHLQTQQYNLTDFTAVSASGGFTVQVTQGSTYGVKVTTDDNLIQYLNVREEGNTLLLELKPGFGYQTTELKAEVTMPYLRSIYLSGGSTLTSQEFNSSDNLLVDLSGGSRVTMAGSAKDLTVTASGGSNINLSNFTVQNASVDMSGGSQCIVNLNGTLNASLSGGSQLHYKGNPTLGRIDTSGGASISPAT